MKKKSNVFGNIAYSIGILLCIVASCSLLFFSYNLITWAFSEHPEIDSSNYDSSYSSYSSYNCDSESIYVQRLNQANSRYDIEKSNYESSKNKYLSASDIDVKVTSFSSWADSYESLITYFNEIINAYNGDPDYFENCIGSTISTNIEMKRSYVDKEELVIDNEFTKLKPQAERAGYTYE